MSIDWKLEIVQFRAISKKRFGCCWKSNRCHPDVFTQVSNSGNEIERKDIYGSLSLLGILNIFIAR